MPRTGSNLLHTGLGQHPAIKLYGELFHKVRAERMSGHAIRRGDRAIFYDEERDDPIAFLDQHVFSPEYAAEAVGLKIFAEYVWRPQTQDLFPRLKSHYPDLRVLHIVRRNYLDVLVSRTVAGLTQEWMRTARSTPVATPTIEIGREEAERFFRSMTLADQFFREMFHSGRYLEVDYDALVSRYGPTLNAAVEFLGLRPFEPKTWTRKQINAPLREIVANYDELKSHFANTAFSAFFEAA